GRRVPRDHARRPRSLRARGAVHDPVRPGGAPVSRAARQGGAGLPRQRLQPRGAGPGVLRRLHRDQPDEPRAGARRDPRRARPPGRHAGPRRRARARQALPGGGARHLAAAARRAGLFARVQRGVRARLGHLPPLRGVDPGGRRGGGAARGAEMPRLGSRGGRDGQTGGADAGRRRAQARRQEAAAETVREEIAILAPVDRSVGPYALVEPLGEGALGTVYRAERDGRPYVVKVVTLAEDGLGARLVEREAKAAARLDHPGCARVIEVGRAGDVLYLVREFVPGRTLGAILAERGRLPAREAVDIAAGVLEAAGV